MNTNDDSGRVTLKQVVDEAADQLEGQVEALAKLCTRAFDIKNGKTQVSHLERVGLTSRRFGDIAAFVKRQTGREGSLEDSRREARKTRRWSKKLDGGACLGERLVEFLEEVRSRADKGCLECGLNELRNEARVRLAGVCLRNIHSAYLYHATLGEGGSS